jgi:hypothetical protein
MQGKAVQTYVTPTELVVARAPLVLRGARIYFSYVSLCIIRKRREESQSAFTRFYAPKRRFLCLFCFVPQHGKFG